MEGEASKRRKILADALEMDRDDSDDESADGDKAAGADASAEKKPAADDDDDDSDDESDDEDETAVLLRELEKIKRERAADKARQDAAASAVRDADVATANPLLNLAAALGAETPAGVSTTVPGTFAVKRRWDDGACVLSPRRNFG
jgi:protein CWC15